jgi:hypothetical protein
MQNTDTGGIEVRLSELDGLYFVRLGDGLTIQLVPHRERFEADLAADPGRTLDLVIQVRAGERSEAQQLIYTRTFNSLPAGEAGCRVRTFRTLPASGRFLVMEDGTQHFCPTPECLVRILREASQRDKEARAAVPDAAYVLLELEKLPAADTKATLETMKPAV